MMRPVVKRAVGGLYSAIAERVYEPLVVRGTFRLLGGDLNDRVIEQGRRAAAVADGRPILDMPVGTGFFTIAIARLHPGIVVGADIAEGMVRAAARAAAGAATPNLVTVRADAHSLPFRDGAFAVVVCANGLQVIPGLAPTLAELARVLAPDGRMFASVVGLPVSGALPAGAAARLPALLRSPRDLVAAFAAAGLTVVAVRRARLAHLVEAERSR